MNKHSTLEAPVWYRYAVKEVRFKTDYVLSAEPVDRRENLLSAFRRMVDDVSYREQYRPNGIPVDQIEGWARASIIVVEDALENPDFRRVQTEPLGSVSIVVEDTA